MLSLEQRRNIENYGMRNGMVNVAFVSGIARNISPNRRSGFIQQTRNLNQLIPFITEGDDFVPAWVTEGNVVKIIARVNGRIGKQANPDDPKSVAIRDTTLRAMRFEQPSVLEMPPEAAWRMSPPKGAPVSDETPGEGNYGDPFSKGSNEVRIAGWVSGVYFRKAGVPGPDGKKPSGCLHVLIQQTKNPDEAIPVRIYGKLSQEHENHIKLGSPVLIQQGEFRIDVKETGVVGADGVAEVTKYAFVKSPGLHVANRSHINEQHDWAMEIALRGKAARDAKSKGGAAPAAPLPPAERPALKIVADPEASAEAPTRQALDAEEQAAIAAATAELGGGKTPVAVG